MMCCSMSIQQKTQLSTICVVLLFTSGCSLEQEENGHDLMVAALAKIKERSPAEHPFLGEAETLATEFSLRSLRDSSPPAQRFKLLNTLSHHRLRFGRIEEATRLLKQSLELLENLF